MAEGQLDNTLCGISPLLFCSIDITILMDTLYQDSFTDNENSSLLKNMDKLKIKPKQIDIVVISHWHSVTTLESFLEKIRM